MGSTKCAPLWLGKTLGHCGPTRMVDGQRLKLGIITRWSTPRGLMKERRWYSVEGETLLIYDKPYTGLARAVSVCHLRDFAYYRSMFNLCKAWGAYPEEN